MQVNMEFQLTLAEFPPTVFRTPLGGLIFLFSLRTRNIGWGCSSVLEHLPGMLDKLWARTPALEKKKRSRNKLSHSIQKRWE
jgi:hypothetical protein